MSENFFLCCPRSNPPEIAPEHVKNNNNNNSVYSRNNNATTIVQNHRTPADVVHKSRVRREIQTRVAMRFLYILLRLAAAWTVFG